MGKRILEDVEKGD